MDNEKMNYSKTVNLPQTDFSMKANLPQREPEFLKKWEEIEIYKKIRERNKGKTKFILHDGPPYANGHIHIGTSLNKILKDFVIKYKTMNGFDSPYTPGWDCHGLPIEQQCMKELKLDKHKVDRLEFRKQAAAFANKFINIQKQEFKRLGVLSDWENPYLTLNKKYEGIIVKIFGDLVKNGYIYRQKKPVYWCPTCETALADAEVEYANHISHSIYVKFEILKYPAKIDDSKIAKEKAYVLIWTTTPWTLPANVALAFQPEAEYVFAKVKYKNGIKENLILSKKLLNIVAEKTGIEEYEIINDFPGINLEGIVCKNPLIERESVGILADFVSLEDGTGVVHIAPGHGQEDYQAGLKYNLPIISPVDDRGIFTEEIKEFAGHKVFAANPLIIEKLNLSGSILAEQKLEHSYPHCWRCKRAIIFRATPQWFMSVENNNLRKNILNIIKSVKWVPSYGENRITGMMEVRPDWCLSRQRLWGVPIPVFYCEKCKEPILDDKVITHIANLFSVNGSDIWFEKTSEEMIGTLNIKCSHCGSDKFYKEEDILDVWFDSGVSSEAVLASGDFPDLTWPADIYLEGSDQHRGWFQTSLIPAVALRQKAPYKTVLTHGFVVDGEGKKMSKSLGNVISSQEIIDKYGADILRLWVAASDYREDIRISPEILKGLIDSYRKIRNTLRFLMGNTSDFSFKNALSYQNMREIDRHALSKLQETIQQVTSAYENFEFHRAIFSINNYCTVYLSGFYLDILKDTLYCDNPLWENRISAQTALNEICLVLIRLIAPILSFTAEECWQEIRKKDNSLDESIFLTEYPKVKNEYVFSNEINNKYEQLFKIREKALLKFEELRREKKIGSNLEAHLDIYNIDADITSDIELLHTVIGTWDISIHKVSDPGNVSEVEVSAKVSTHAKCERCWRRKEDVNNNNKYNGMLCSRCVQSLDKINAKN